MIILGIETSCDETSAAVIKNGQVLSNIVLSQTVHSKFGGVVPDLASKNHDKYIYDVVQKSITDSGVNINDLSAVCVTYGSGLLSSLIVGVNFAKGLSVGLNIPFIGINHLEGHLYSSFINKTIEYPFLSLIVSGGHTQIWIVNNYNDYKIVSTTVDDAAGEAFDKGAKILGLGYPGGPEIEKNAINGNPQKYKFTIPVVKSNIYNYSFSGLKTALLYHIKELKKNNTEYLLSDIACSYQESIIDTLLSKLTLVIKETKISKLSIVGGVSANKRFRYKADLLKNKFNLDIMFPEMKYCTDNAAMIAMAGYLKYKNKDFSELTLTPNPNLSSANV